MPIYAYRCDACGFAKDVLQKVSDAPLTECPSCGRSEFKKQLTAAGFQLKGTGWYVTDFRGGSSGTGKTASDSKPGDASSASKTETPATSEAAASSGGAGGDTKAAAS